MEELKDIVGGSLLVRATGGCIILGDKDGKRYTLCYPIISDAVVKGIVEITELHRREGGQEIDVHFEKPTQCIITDDHVLRCPKEEKMDWEKKGT